MLGFQFKAHFEIDFPVAALQEDVNKLMQDASKSTDVAKKVFNVDNMDQGQRKRAIRKASMVNICTI